MNLNVNLNNLENIIIEKLNNNGLVIFESHGTSMMPMLHNTGDSITLKKIDRKLHKYDIIFYKRHDNSYVLHRIIKIKKDGYVLRGDNQFVNEYNITDDMIIAYLVSFKRNGKQYDINKFSYKLYCRFWVNTKSIRHLLIKIKHLFKHKKN